MLSAYLVRPELIELREVPIPEPGKGEVLVRTRAALTCGTDLKAFLRGHSLIPMPGPFGHEFSGVVSKTGTGVRKFREADEIMSVHSAPCLRCPHCAHGRYHLCDGIMDSKILGAFSEYILLPEHIVLQNSYKKPPSLSFAEAAMLEPLACVVHPYGSVGVRAGDRALIFGAGPIGLLHLLFLNMNGVRVSVTDVNADRLASASSLGADAAVVPEELEDFTERATAGMGFDLVVECTGQPAVWEASVRHARRGGTVLLFGGCKPGTRVSFDTHRLHYDELALVGSFHFTPRDVTVARRLLGEGRLNTAPLISGTVPLRDIQSAFDRLRAGEGIKYAIAP